MKAEAWYLLTALSCNKVFGKEEISQILEILRKERGNGGQLILYPKNEFIFVSKGRSCFASGSQPVFIEKTEAFYQRG